jgi:uncharacterized protein YjbI with pentapeptide repeats
MPARSRAQRVVPELPDLPHELVAAPDVFGSGAWEGLATGSALSLPERVYDLEMVECVWQDVDATSRRFSGLVCRDVVFEHCDFAGAVLDSAVLTRVHFVGCRLTGTALSGAEMNDVVIDGGAANLLNLRASNSSFLWIRDSPLREADFYQAQLRHSALLDCDLTGANFSSARVDGLSLHGSTIEALRGAESFGSSDVHIAQDQLVSLGVAVLASMGVRVDDRPDGP